MRRRRERSKSGRCRDAQGDTKTDPGEPGDLRICARIAICWRGAGEPDKSELGGHPSSLSGVEAL